MNKIVLVIVAVATCFHVALTTPVEDETAQKDAPKVQHISVTVNKGAIYFDQDTEHIYRAPLDAEVHVNDGKIYVNDQLAYDYDTNTTYIPSHQPTRSERRSCAKPFTIYLRNGNIFNEDDSFATRVWRKKKYSWKNGKIYSQGKLAYDTCTKERHMPSYEGPDFPVDENLIKIKDGKVVEGKNDNIYVDGVLVDEDNNSLSDGRIHFQIGGLENKTLYANTVPVLRENPQESRSYKFLPHDEFDKELQGKYFKITTRDGTLYYITDNMNEEEPLFPVSSETEDKPDSQVEGEKQEDNVRKSKHISITVDKGAIYIDHDERYVYTAPLDAEVYVQNGKIYVNDQLAYDYDTNTTYIPSHKPTNEELESCAQPFTIYLGNGNIFNGDDSFATRVWRKFVEER